MPKEIQPSPRPQPPSPHPFTLDQRLRRSERILTRADFLHVQHGGRRSSNPALIAIVSNNDLPWSRIGVTVSKKVGNAVVRNRIKRRLRAVFRRTKAQLPQGVDLVWIARPSVVNFSSQKLEEFAVKSSQKALTSPMRGRTKRGAPRPS